jgi:hypothetical protein
MQEERWKSTSLGELRRKVERIFALPDSSLKDQKDVIQEAAAACNKIRQGSN